VKILIVDDDEALQGFLAQGLEARGYEVLQTHTGDEGLELYRKNGPFALVLSDYRFTPGTRIKDGVQLVAAIHETNPSQKMAIMTAVPNEAREKLPKALWHLRVLVKPFKLEQVLRLLREPVLPL